MQCILHFGCPRQTLNESCNRRMGGGWRQAAWGMTAASAGHEIILKRPQNDFIQLKCQKRCLFSLFNAVNIYTFIYAADAFDSPFPPPCCHSPFWQDITHKIREIERERESCRVHQVPLNGWKSESWAAVAEATSKVLCHAGCQSNFNLKNLSN